MTVMQKKPENPIAHLSAEDIEIIGKELDTIRQEVRDSLGEDDAKYIRRVIDVQRKLELGSRAVLLVSMFPPAWLVGTVGLSVAKILENMEIGHNILHGQWDWMRDPKIHSTTWEWDMASPAEQWKHSHNELHHTYTNVIGKDNDLGYGIMRVDEDQKWHPLYLAQPLWNFINACFFEYGIAAYDLELGKNLATKKRRANPEFRARRQAGAEARSATRRRKDYLVHPLLSGPVVPADAGRQLHRQRRPQPLVALGDHVRPLPRGRRDVREDVDRRRDPRRVVRAPDARLGQHLRVSKAMHLMTGNLSHQVEHHLFPDLPSNRYAEIAPQVKDIFDRYGLTYHSAPLYKQVASAWHKVIRLSLPNGWLAETTPANAPAQVVKLVRMTTGGKKVRRELSRAAA